MNNEKIKRTVKIESSMYSPTSRWNGTYYEEIAVIEFDKELDDLEDEQLLELADNDDERVKYIE